MCATRSRRFQALVILIATFLAAACQEDGSVIVGSIDLIGVTAVEEGRLKAVLATRESSVLPWGRRASFDRSRLDTDLKRIQTFYDDRGYPDARITSVDVHRTDAGNAVDISVTIDEGEPVLVRSFRFAGFDALPADRLEGFQHQEDLRRGQPRDRRDVLAIQELALNDLRDNGYPYARISTDEQRDTTGKLADITFTAEPGTLARFGTTEIAGNETVSGRVIERQLTYHAGELYRRRLVQESQRRLYGMELFQFVNIEALDPERQEPEVRTRVTVAEGRHQRANIGVGYGTEDKARVEGEYRHLNFFGGARSAGTNGRWSTLDRGVRVNLTQPYFFHPRLSLGADAQLWRTLSPAYESIVFSGGGAVTYQVDPRMTVTTFVSGEDSSSSVSADALSDPALRNELIALGLDPTTGKQEGRFGSLAVAVQRSTVDNVIEPRGGYQLVTRLEQTGVFLPSSFDYSVISFDARHYLPMGDTLVIASRLQAGTIVPGQNDPANVPFSKKYFLGGATSMRGWGRYEVSPLSESGLPIGGNSLLAFNAELRATFGNVGGVVFLDAGNVWSDDRHVDLADLRYAVGVGMRYRTPVGPIRFDYGRQVNPIEGLLVEGEPQLRSWRAHFSIGHAF